MIVGLLTQILSYANVTTVLLFTVIAYFTWKYFQDYNLPPGPWGLPIVGYLPFMARSPPHVIFNDLCKKYGNLISVKCGSKLVVVLGDYDAIKEAFLKQADNFAGRPQDPPLNVDENEMGIFPSDGEPWREHRRFVVSTLRDYGMGKLSFEPRLMEEAHAFLDELAKQKGAPCDISKILGPSTSNIIFTLLFGKRFDYKDQSFIKLVRDLDELIKLFTTVSTRTLLPWIKYVPFSDRITQLKRTIRVNAKVMSFITRMVDEHKLSHTENSKIDVIDAFLTERNATIEKLGNEVYFSDNDLNGTLLNLFEGGGDTMTTAILWGILFMILHPDVQKKVQKEIDDVIGMDRDPTMSDRLKMTYTDAVIMETLRCGNIAPTAAPHANLEETELYGYRIPKRSFIVSNVWAVHNDQKLWKEPEKFVPERFINKDGRLEKPEFFIPFGVGKRLCAGEPLAKMEHFLYFTALLQRFTFQSPAGKTPSLDLETSAVRRPKPFNVCAIQRPGYGL